VLLAVSLFYLLIVAYAVVLLFPFITKPEVLLPVTISLTSVVLSWSIVVKKLTKLEDKEEIRATIDWNYKRLKRGVENERLPLLKALILMRTLQKDFELSEVRGKYPSLFNEENLLGSLYHLFPQSLLLKSEENLKKAGKTEKI